MEQILLEKLTGFQLVKKFPKFYGTRRFITAVTSPRHLSLSWANSIQSTPPHPTSWRSILILYPHLRLGLPNGLFTSRFPTKSLYTALPHTRYMPRPSQCPNKGLKSFTIANLTQCWESYIPCSCQRVPKCVMWQYDVSSQSVSFLKELFRELNIFVSRFICTLRLIRYSIRYNPWLNKAKWATLHISDGSPPPPVECSPASER